MTPAFTVWQWDEFNGWSLMLGAPDKASAEQAREALRFYQPGKWYQVFARNARYWLTPAYEVFGMWQGRRVSWGWTPSPESAWIVMYALAKILTTDVKLGLKAQSPATLSQVNDAMPDFVRIELGRRARLA